MNITRIGISICQKAHSDEMGTMKFLEAWSIADLDHLPQWSLDLDGLPQSPLVNDLNPRMDRIGHRYSPLNAIYYLSNIFEFTSSSPNESKRVMT